MFCVHCCFSAVYWYQHNRVHCSSREVSHSLSFPAGKIMLQMSLIHHISIHSTYIIYNDPAINNISYNMHITAMIQHFPSYKACYCDKGIVYRHKVKLIRHKSSSVGCDRINYFLFGISDHHMQMFR